MIKMPTQRDACSRVPPAHPERWEPPGVAGGAGGEQGAQEEWRQRAEEWMERSIEEWRKQLAAFDEGVLPADPRQWTRAHVQVWLAHIAARHGFEVRASRFLMNGKALCLMSAGMYARRVPQGGALLHKDFRRRLARALACS